MQDHGEHDGLAGRTRGPDGSESPWREGEPMYIVSLTQLELEALRAGLLLADAYEARAEDTWGEEEDPIRARWRALADKFKVEQEKLWR